MNFVVSVALFGMQLQKPKFKNRSKKKDVLRLENLRSVNDKEGYRKEFIRLVKAY